MAVNQIDELKRENLCLRQALEKLEDENKQQAEFLSLAKEQMDAYQAELARVKNLKTATDRVMMGTKSENKGLRDAIEEAVELMDEEPAKELLKNALSEKG